MALIECTECGKQISDKATSCPGCGCPSVSKEGMPRDKIDVIADKFNSVTLIHMIIALEIVAAFIFSKYLYDILQYNGDRAYLYKMLGSEYPLFLFAPLVFGLISVVGKSFKVYEVFTTLLFGLSSIGLLVFTTSSEYYTVKVLLIGALVVSSFCLIATNREALVADAERERLEEGSVSSDTDAGSEESKTCLSCKKPLSAAVKKCNFCGDLNSNFSESALSSFAKIQHVCAQCGWDLENLEPGASCPWCSFKMEPLEEPRLTVRAS